MEQKVCSDCGQTKPVSEFRAHKAAPDGYEKRCKACRARKLGDDKANLAFCEAMRKRRYDSLYPTPQYIYGLVDPRSGDVRYIGHSHNPTKRAQSHANQGSGENWRLREWIEELQAAGLRPELRELACVAEDEFVLERERRWIMKGIRDGWPLLNAEAHVGGFYRDDSLTRQIMESSCLDFLTEPRTSPLLAAIGVWRGLAYEGDRWLRKPFLLRTAIKACLKLCPDELPPRLLPEVERMEQERQAERAKLLAEATTAVWHDSE
jgi:hypothetical protein